MQNIIKISSETIFFIKFFTHCYNERDEFIEDKMQYSDVYEPILSKY